MRAGDGQHRAGAGLAGGVVGRDVEFESYELDIADGSESVPTDGPRRSESGNELADSDHALRALAGHVGELRR